MSGFCEQCGKKLEDAENFCPYCGAKVVQDESTTDTSPISITNESSDSTKKLIVVGVGIFFLLTGVIFFHNQKQEESSIKKTEIQSTSQIKKETDNTQPNLSHETNKSVDKTVNTLESLNKSDLLIGGLTLGMSRQNVKQKLGFPLNDSEDYYNYGDIEVSFDKNGVKTVACSNNPSYNTPRGIHIGSTLAEVKSAYGTNYFTDNDAKGTIYTYPLEKAHLRFVIDGTGRVNRIAFYNTESNLKPTEKPNTSAEKPNSHSEKPKTSHDEYNYSCKVDGKTTYKGIKRLGLSCALYSVKKQKSITSDFGSNYTARGTFYIVTVIVSNSTNEPIFVPSIYLMDDRGRKFSSDISAGATWQTMHGVESDFQLNPGQPGWLYEIFDIPDDANIKNLRCEASFSLEDNEFDVPFRVVTQ